MALRLNYVLALAVVAMVAFLATVAPAFASNGWGNYNSGGTEVSVVNKNEATINNTTEAKADTGDNYAGGSEGGDGDEGGNGGDGGDAEDNEGKGDNTGGNGGNAGAGGNGGNASDGGVVVSGDATANASTLLVTNTNATEVEGCGCTARSSGKGYHRGGKKGGSSGTEVRVYNDNGANITNDTKAKADTGDNKAKGSEGGDGDEGGNGGDGGDAEDNGDSDNKSRRGHHSSRGGSSGGDNVGGSGGAGADGGNGGSGGLGGAVQTGDAESNARTIMVTNTNLFRFGNDADESEEEGD